MSETRVTEMAERVLHRARMFIDHDGGWIQHKDRRKRPDGLFCYCLRGAVQDAAESLMPDLFNPADRGPRPSLVRQGRVRAFDCLARVIREQYPDVPKGLPWEGTCIAFNDTEGRRKVEVLRVLVEALTLNRKAVAA